MLVNEFKMLIILKEERALFAHTYLWENFPDCARCDFLLFFYYLFFLYTVIYWFSLFFLSIQIC